MNAFALPILTLCVTFVASPLAFAQNQQATTESAPTAAQKMYLDYLTAEGFRPSVDSDGDVGFKYEGGQYFIVIDEDDDQFFRLIYPGFWDIEDEDERRRALESVEAVNSKVKSAKIYIIRDSAWAGVESFVPERGGFEAIFDRSLSALQTAFNTFADEMKSRQ